MNACGGLSPISSFRDMWGLMMMMLLLLSYQSIMHWIIGRCFHVTVNLWCFQNLLPKHAKKKIILVESETCLYMIFEKYA